jgi:hypothetical protein
MAATTANEIMKQHRQETGDGDGEKLTEKDRQLFKRGGSIAVTLTATGRDVHDLTADGSATVCVYADAIVIVPGGSDE